MKYYFRMHGISWTFCSHTTIHIYSALFPFILNLLYFHSARPLLLYLCLFFHIIQCHGNRPTYIQIVLYLRYFLSIYRMIWFDLVLLFGPLPKFPCHCTMNAGTMLNIQQEQTYIHLINRNECFPVDNNSLFVHDEITSLHLYSFSQYLNQFQCKNRCPVAKMRKKRIKKHLIQFEWLHIYICIIHSAAFEFVERHTFNHIVVCYYIIYFVFVKIFTVNQIKNGNCIEFEA